MHLTRWEAPSVMTVKGTDSRLWQWGALPWLRQHLQHRQMASPSSGTPGTSLRQQTPFPGFPRSHAHSHPVARMLLLPNVCAQLRGLAKKPSPEGLQLETQKAWSRPDTEDSFLSCAVRRPSFKPKVLLQTPWSMSESGLFQLGYVAYVTDGWVVWEPWDNQLCPPTGTILLNRT